MNNMVAMGGPAGAQRMQNIGTPSAMQANSAGEHKRKLDTYIYDHFLRNGHFDLARALIKELDIDTSDKPSPSRKDMNGMDGMEDSKLDDMNRPPDLPRANVPHEADTSFLLDWWAQFWDCWSASRNKTSTPARQYIEHVQRQNPMNAERRAMPMNQQMQMMNARNGMGQNGGPMAENMKKAMMMQSQMGNRPNPQQLQAYRMQQAAQQQQQLAAQTQMQREGSQMDMNGQPRPQSPASGDAPSPKRQRLEGGAFNGGPMGPMGRGQNPGMPNAQFNGMQMPNGQAKPMQGMPNPMQQGSPAVDQGVDMFGNSNNLRQMGQPGQPNSNHALQDYQMQLMLLEQQNKKRLLMARQEADNQTGPGPMPGQPGFNAPAMSPSNSRTGPSPNPDDQMKRGTPKMAPGGMGPGLDGMQGRASPIPGFDPSQMNPNMPPNFQTMKMPGAIMGPNGHMMPATSHPAFNAQMNGQMNGQMNPQQMEIMRQQAARGAGQWPGGPPPGMMHPGQPQQQPNMTPQQRNTAMPPPPAPATGDNQNRTQPSSPSQNAAPPTPSQANKPNPKKKESANKANKKATGKKNATTAATPASEVGDQPPTPTPAPPITPTPPSQQFNKGGPGAAAPMGGQAGVVPNAMPQSDLTGGGFGGALDGGEMNFGMDFGNLDGQDVLDNFDFDAFLNNEAGDGGFAFDASMGFGGDGLEAGGDV